MTKTLRAKPHNVSHPVECPKVTGAWFSSISSIAERSVAVGCTGPSQGRKSLEGMFPGGQGWIIFIFVPPYHLSWCFAPNRNLTCLLIEHISRMFCCETEFQAMAALYSFLSFFVPCHLHSSHYHYQTIQKTLSPGVDQCYDPQRVTCGHVTPYTEMQITLSTDRGS